MIKTIPMEEMQKLRDSDNYCAHAFFSLETMNRIPKHEWSIPRKQISALGNIKFCCTEASKLEPGKTFWFSAETQEDNIAILNAMITLKNKYRIEQLDLIPSQPFGYGTVSGMNGQSASCPAFTSK
ncbi:hypothetical protein GQ473_02055 [archaeon]|nr:hypothetical protein [archaeon]